jgi:hypothetical protein
VPLDRLSKVVLLGGGRMSHTTLYTIHYTHLGGVE